MANYINVFSPYPILPSYQGSQEIALTSSITLSWTTQFQDINPIVAVYMFVTPSASGFTITLPDATQASNGIATTFINLSGSRTFTVADNAGNPLVTIAAGAIWTFVLQLNTTVAGTWTLLPPAGSPTVTSISVVSGSPDLTVAGSPITSSGTITLNFAQDLLQLSSFGNAVGIAARTAVNTWALRSLTGTVNQITVANPQGVAGNPTFALASNITGISSITAGNLLISGNTISAINLNGNVILTPQTTGPTIGEVIANSNVSIESGHSLKLFNPGNTNYLALSAGNRTTTFNYVLPTVDPIANQVMQCGSVIGATAFLDWANIPTFPGSSTPTALARFSDTIGSLENSVVLLDNSGNLTQINSAVINALDISVINAFTISSPSNNPIVFSPNGINEVVANGILSVANGNVLKFYAPGSTYQTGPYFSLSSGASLVTNINMFLPFTAPVAGQALYASSASQLGWKSFSGISGATTTTAIARFADTAGTLENSGVLIDNSNNITGATSLAVGNLSISGSTIASSFASNIILSPDTLYEVQSNRNINLQSGNLLKWFNPLNTFFFSLQAPSLTSTISMFLPLTAAVAGQALVATTATQFGWGSFAGVSGATTVNAIARYNDTVGTIKNSGVLIDNSNNVTGANSLVAGNVSLATNVVSNTGIANLNVTAATGNLLLNSTAGNITLSPFAGQPVNVIANLVVESANALQLNNTANTQNIQISTPGALAASYSVLLPATIATLNQFLKVTNVSGTQLQTSWSSTAAVNPNILMNGDMSVWQRYTTFNTTTTGYLNNNGVYTADGWTLQSDGNNIVTVSRAAGPYGTAFDCEFSWQATVVTTNKKFGVAQFIENLETRDYTGATLSLSFSASTVGLSNARAAIIVWTGTADTVTNPIVTTWNASGANPTLAAGWSYLSTTANLALSASFTQYTLTNVAVTGAGINNLSVFVWVDDTLSIAGNTLSVSSLKLEVGTTSTQFVSNPIALTFERCKRYFEKGLPYTMPLYTVIAAGNVYSNAVIIWQPGTNITNGSPYHKVTYKVLKRIAGTAITYPCTTPTNTFRCSNSAFTDQAASSAIITTVADDVNSFMVTNNSGGVLAVVNQYQLMNWYIDASL